VGAPTTHLPIFPIVQFLYDKKSNQIKIKLQAAAVFFSFFFKLSPGCPPLTSYAIQRERSFSMRPSFLPYFTRYGFHAAFSLLLTKTQRNNGAGSSSSSSSSSYVYLT
jgi:hypothetical protein